MMRLAFWLGPPIGGFLTFIAFSMWAFFTLAVIIVMEGVSASLHTLQLHWLVWKISLTVCGKFVHTHVVRQKLLFSQDNLPWTEWFLLSSLRNSSNDVFFSGWNLWVSSTMAWVTHFNHYHSRISAVTSSEWIFQQALPFFVAERFTGFP